MFSQRGEIVSVMIHVMTAAGLGGTSMPATIVRDDAKAFPDKEKHLRIPVVRRKRPTVAEDDRLSAPPVLIIDVDVCSVFFSDGDVWHRGSFLYLAFTKNSSARRSSLSAALPKSSDRYLSKH